MKEEASSEGASRCHNTVRGQEVADTDYGVT